MFNDTYIKDCPLSAQANESHLMHALKVPQFLPNCTNKYAKKNEEKEKEEKEENITILMEVTNNYERLYIQ